MPPKPSPIFVPPQQPSPTAGTRVLVSSRQADGQYCVLEMTEMPGGGVPLHIQRDEEFYYILDGSLEMRAGDDRFTAEAGSTVVIPRGVPHGFHNASDLPARWLVIFRPGGFDELVDELHQCRTDGVESDRQREAILAKWGVEFLEDESQS